jgi:diguanylate cyclase (GGDEF)-like protein
VELRYLNSLPSIKGDLPFFTDNNYSNCYIGLVDVDKLSDYNRLNGYEQGDYQLEKLCEILKLTLPSETLLIRLGSDEFIFILNLALYKHELLKSIAFSVKTKLSVTVSICVLLNDEIENIKLVLTKLKTLMLQIKQSEGNNIYVHNEIRTT